MRLSRIIVIATSLITAMGSLHAVESVRWREKLSRDPAWFATDQAFAVAENLLLYQLPSGGWPKNIDMAAPLTEEQKAALTARDETRLSGDKAATIDNGATTTQIRFLAEIFAAKGDRRHRDAALRGIDYLLTAQSSNGGWPQFFPLRKGYYSHITFNDDAMINVMEVLRDVAAGNKSFPWVDEARRTRASSAIARGLECILRCQIAVDGKPTVWGAQHDETTFAPAPARKFEPVSFTSHESAGIVRYLMAIENPPAPVVAAVQGAVAWFERTKLAGLRYEYSETSTGKDSWIVATPGAPPLWARFYELGTERPIFIGRDSVIRYTLAEIDRERRGGYGWYGDRPAEILRKYPAWAAKSAKHP